MGADNLKGINSVFFTSLFAIYLQNGTDREATLCRTVYKGIRDNRQSIIIIRFFYSVLSMDRQQFRTLSHL